MSSPSTDEAQRWYPLATRITGPHRSAWQAAIRQINVERIAHHRAINTSDLLRIAAQLTGALINSGHVRRVDDLMRLTRQLSDGSAQIVVTSPPQSIPADDARARHA